MPRTTRTFIAVPIPGPLKAKFERLRERIAPEVPGARWVGAEGLHLTLAFLGDVHETDLNTVCRAVTNAVAPYPRFDLAIEGLGAFPNPGVPRVLWAGVVGDLDALADVRQAVFDAVTEAGYRPDDERFHPHVTLARIKSGRGDAPNLQPLVDRRNGWSAGTFTADSVVTYASTTAPDGPMYAPLGSARLAKGGRA